MKKCPNCGSGNSIESSYCFKCGTRLVTEEEAILNQIKDYRPAPSQLTDRISSLKRMMEYSPPGFHNYFSLMIIMGATLGIGVLLMIGGGVGIGSALAKPYPSNPTEITNRTLIIVASAGGIVIGFMLIAYGQYLKLLMDLQENADRQSIALHGIFNVLLSGTEKEGNHEPGIAKRD